MRTLNIRNWPFGIVRDRNHTHFSEEDTELIRNAVRRAGIQQNESSFVAAIRKIEPRPSMALVIAFLADLTSLYAHLPETDIFLAEVLRRAPQGREYRPRALHNLREAHLTSTWNYRSDWRARDEYILGLDHL